MRDADLVLVFDHGKIVERGTHDSLIKKVDGMYRYLVQRQLQGGQMVGRKPTMLVNKPVQSFSGKDGVGVGKKDGAK